MYGSDDKPFCACSTPGGVSGIAVIRLSGNGAGEVADKAVKIIKTYGDSKDIVSMPGYTAAFAIFFDPKTGEKIDEVVINHFVPPHSFTGDEMVEISCHGSSLVKSEILRVLVENGARAALPGEFTKRAFLNGKMDLTQAEAVMNVIAADSERALKASNSQLNGKLKDALLNAESKLYEALSLIEMIVEFPEHDDTPENTEKVRDLCVQVKDTYSDLKRSYAKGRVLSERMKIALAGLPNSGKSSLLNSLTGYDRAIVTEVAGTTRDTLEADVSVNGIPVTVVDTAGIRQTGDRIEAIGVERAKKASAESDLVFYLVAPDTEVAEVKSQLQELLSNGTAPSSMAVLFSKSDIGKNPNEEKIREEAQSLGITDFIEVSSADGIALSDLKDHITKVYENLGGLVSSETILMNSRHAEIIDKAEGYLDMAIDAIDNELGVDVASSVLRLCLEKTGEITGKSVSNELVDSIFSKFCIGK